MNKISFELQIKTVSEANCSEHWTKKSKRHKQQQFFIRLAIKPYEKIVQVPCTVKMIRISPGVLDDDNLRTAFKFIRDEISECLLPEFRKTYINNKGKMIAIKGRADSDERIKWEYDQRKGSRYSVEIQICYDA